MNHLLNSVLLLSIFIITACSSPKDDSIEEVNDDLIVQSIKTTQEFTDITSKTLHNEAAYITSMCYTKTKDEHNNTLYAKRLLQLSRNKS